MSANEQQVGGSHYREKGEHQPWDVIEAWGLGFLDGNCVKYLSRWRQKGGVQDLEKARHYLDKLIERERPLQFSIRPDPCQHRWLGGVHIGKEWVCASCKATIP